MGLGCCCGTVSECNRGVNRHHGTEGERGSRFGRVKHGPPGRPCCAKASRLVHSCNSPSQDLSLEEYLVEHHASLSEAFVGNQSTCTYYPTAGVAPSPTKATLAPPSLTEKAVSSPCSPVVVAAQPTRPRSPSGLHGMSSKVHAFLFPFSRITDARRRELALGAHRALSIRRRFRCRRRGLLSRFVLSSFRTLVSCILNAISPRCAGRLQARLDSTWNIPRQYATFFPFLVLYYYAVSSCPEWPADCSLGSSCS